MNRIIKSSNYKIIKLSNYLIIALIIISCAESERYKITPDDSTPPAAPAFVKSRPLPGGAVIYFQVPDERDVLAVETSFKGADGKNIRSASSVFVDTVEVTGFGSAGEHTVELTAVDIAGNRSTPLTVTVTADEPPVIAVAKSVKVYPAFGSLVIAWEDKWLKNVSLTVALTYTPQGGTQVNQEISFDTYMTERRTISGIPLVNGEKVQVKTSVIDKFGNTAQGIDTLCVLLVDKAISKAGWSLPAPGTVIGGVVQSDGNYLFGRSENAIDGLKETDENATNNYWHTTQTNPWNIIIDLGAEYELSRIVTHQRYSYTELNQSIRGAYYRGDNVLRYNMYIFNSTTQQWEIASLHEISVPVVMDQAEYRLLGDRGDESYLYPELPRFSRPARYFRLEAINGKYISEITLYGKN
ncbi:MAG: DUF4959 domain-containing protein [Tannerella sp.]|jgi:hypothetical protein|nr:DUF4959 domain-containing protein [Tannerella sp.]